MKKGLTELVFILDRSGSMAPLTEDTIGGFNAMIAKQKKEEGECLVSTVLFANDSAVIHDRLPLAEVPDLTDRDYCAGGCTALLDAVGTSIRHIETIHRYARPEDVPERTLFVITTDGMENASHKFNYPAVKEMIEAKKKLGWEFMFIGANIDAAAEAARMGIDRDSTANYIADCVGTAAVFESVGNNLGFVRKHGRNAANWQAEIVEDLKRRKK